MSIETLTTQAVTTAQATAGSVGTGGDDGGGTDLKPLALIVRGNDDIAFCSHSSKRRQFRSILFLDRLFVCTFNQHSFDNLIPSFKTRHFSPKNRK